VLRVLPAHRPTLSDLAGPRLARLPRALRIALALLGALLVIALGWLVLRSGTAESRLVHRGVPAFNFKHPESLGRVAPEPGEIVRLERRRDGLFVQSFAVEPLTLPAYEGAIGGALPAFASRYIERLAVRFPGFELVQEGRSNVNYVSGYGVLFQARLGERRLYGRAILLPEPTIAARRGVILMLLATPAAGVSRAEEVGIRGVV